MFLILESRYSKILKPKIDPEDRAGTTCQQPYCKGTYIETSIHDDIDGIQHCSKCNHAIKRYKEDETND